MTTLTEMRADVRRDLKDEVAAGYRWSDDEIDRAIEKAVLVYSSYCPLMQLDATIHTVDQGNTVSLATLTERIDVVKVEHPIDNQPYPSRRFKVWGDLLTFQDGYTGDGGVCNIYWLKKHTLGAFSTIPAAHDHIIAVGAVAFAVSSQAQYQVNLANTGGRTVNKDYGAWARAAFEAFYRLLQNARSYSPGKLVTGELTVEA
ncbi:MAG: hypothetical protein WC169_05640 [Dehalococcoidia bacterium]|jgi:hypothetical protein